MEFCGTSGAFEILGAGPCPLWALLDKETGLVWTGDALVLLFTFVLLWLNILIIKRFGLDSLLDSIKDCHTY